MNYLQIIPTKSPIQASNLPKTLESLHILTNRTETSLIDRLNPTVKNCAPVFEFLAVSRGEDESVEFYYGVNQQPHHGTLEDRLRSIFPNSFKFRKPDEDVLEDVFRTLDHREPETSDNVTEDDA